MTRSHFVPAILLIGALLGGVACDTVAVPASPSEAPASAANADFSTNPAERSLTKACDAGNLKACVSLASRLLSGRGVKRSFKASMGYYERTCKKGYAPACHGQGVLLRDVLKTPKANAQARVLFERNCAREFWASCGSWSHMMMVGQGGGVDLPQAQQIAVKACAQHKESISCFVAAKILDQRNAQPTKARDFARTSCDLKHWGACVLLGNMHAEGKGQEPSIEQAQALYKRACDSSPLAQGCLESAALLRKAKQLTMAYELEQKACKRGVARACVAQAQAMISASGTPSNLTRGKAILRQHCAQKLALACDALTALNGTP